MLKGINLRLKRGSRCLLIGANGAGKSTLLRILGGRHLTKPDEAVNVLGMNAFRDTKLNMVRAYMDTDWGMRTVAFAGALVGWLVGWVVIFPTLSLEFFSPPQHL